MTDKQRRILAFLSEYGPATPTRIGELVGGRDYNRASTWACSTLSAMHSAGWVDRDNKRAPYRITIPGRLALWRDQE